MTLKALRETLSEMKYMVDAVITVRGGTKKYDSAEIDVLGDAEKFANAFAKISDWEAHKAKVAYVRFSRVTNMLVIGVTVTMKD